jgi:hypothetical protein
MGGLISLIVLTALVATLFVAAVYYMAFQAGALSARKTMARSQGSVTLGGALKAYTLAMIALIGAIVLFAAFLEMVLAA